MRGSRHPEAELERVTCQVRGHVVLRSTSQRNPPPSPGLGVKIKEEEVQVGCQMKYLGLTIDSQWTFGPHFDLLVPKVTAAANALYGLLPNIEGAGIGVRQLYEAVVRFRVLYGAPVWAEHLPKRRRTLLLVRGCRGLRRCV
jgi:hypothetical protein